MAYCRFGADSDVYMYRTFAGNYQFFISDKNSLKKKGSEFMVSTLSEVLHRLTRLKTQGFKIPQYTIDRVRGELNNEEVENEGQEF